MKDGLERCARAREMSGDLWKAFPQVTCVKGRVTSRIIAEFVLIVNIVYELHTYETRAVLLVDNLLVRDC